VHNNADSGLVGLGPVDGGIYRSVLSGEKLTRSSQACDSEELRCSLRRERFEFNLPEIKGFGGILEACDNGP